MPAGSSARRGTDPRGGSDRPRLAGVGRLGLRVHCGGSDHPPKLLMPRLATILAGAALLGAAQAATPTGTWTKVRSPSLPPLPTPHSHPRRSTALLGPSWVGHRPGLNAGTRAPRATAGVTSRRCQVLLTDAVKSGARCLDGSPGGYYLRTHNAKGVAADPKKWILFMQVARAPHPTPPQAPPCLIPRSLLHAAARAGGGAAPTRTAPSAPGRTSAPRKTGAQPTRTRTRGARPSR